MLTRGYYKTLYEPMREIATPVLEDYIKNPDKGSEFEVRTRQIRHLPASEQIKFLLSGKAGDYDALVCFKNTEVAGFFAFERKPEQKEIHVFRLQTEKKYQQNGVAVGNLAQLAMDAFNNGYTKLQVGKGTDEDTTRVLNSFNRRYAKKFNVEVKPETGEVLKRA